MILMNILVIVGIALIFVFLYLEIEHPELNSDSDLRRNNTLYIENNYSDDETNPSESEWVIGPFTEHDPNYSSWIGKN